MFITLTDTTKLKIRKYGFKNTKSMVTDVRIHVHDNNPQTLLFIKCFV
jgi:hypothetical protein